MPTTPILTQPRTAAVQKIEARTRGAAGIYLTALRSVNVGNVSIPDTPNLTGLSTGSDGDILLTVLSGDLTISEIIDAAGGDNTLTSDTIAILARLRSFDGGVADPRGHPLL